MFNILKKLYKFAGNYKKLLTWVFTAGVIKSAFDLVQVGAVYLAISGIINGVTESTIIWVTVTMLIYLFGKFFFSTQADYWRGMSGLMMCTSKRMELGNTNSVMYLWDISATITLARLLPQSQLICIWLK